MSLSFISMCVVLIRCAGVGFQALIIVLLANSISVVEMGLFSALYIFWGLTRALGPLGLDQLSMRDIARFATSDPARAQAISGFAFFCVAGIGLLVALVSASFLQLLAAAGVSLYTTPTVIAAAAAAPAYALNGLLSAQLRGFGRAIHSQVSEAITLHALSLAIMGLLAYNGLLSLESAIITQAAAAWVVFSIYAALRLRCGIDPAARLAPETRRRSLREAFQIWQALGLGNLSERLPVYICLALLGPAATAIIDIANRFGSLPSIVTDGVATTFAPVFAQLHAGADPQEYRDTLTLSSWLAFLPAAAVLAGLLLVGPWLLDVFFPPVYQKAFWPMVLICTATTINAAFGLASNTFMVTGRQTLVRRFSAYSLGFIVFGCFAFGWLWGALGIAAAILAGALIRDGGMAWMLSRDIGGPVMLDLRLPQRLVRTALATPR